MNKMDPLIATMDQSSIGNKTKKLTSGPNSKEHSSKSTHKTDQESTSPVKPIHSDAVSPPFDGLSSKNNHFMGKNYHHTNNRHEESHDPAQVLHDKHDYDDNKDVVVVRDYNSKNVRRNQDSNISDTMANLSIDSSSNKVNNMNQNKCHQLEGTSTSSPTSSHPIAPNRTSVTNSTNTTAISTTPTPIPIPSTTPILTSCIDMSSKNCELSEACTHQPTPSLLPTSAALPQISDNIVASNGRALGNHIVDKDASFMQQRRQAPIIKAQSLDYACDVDYEVDQVQSHLQNCHYLFQHNHLHHNHSNHRNHHLHNQYLHHNNHFPHNWTSSSSSLSGRKYKQTITKGCSLDNRRSEEDDGPQCSNIISTTTTEDVDADVDEDDDEELAIKRAPTLTTNSLRSHTLESDTPSPHHLPRGSFDSTSSTGDTTDSSQQTDSAGGVRLTSPQPRQHNLPKGILPKVQSLESRPIYPNVPYSPYASPYGSPRSNRRRTPLRESRRISIEQSGSFLQLNQYKLMDQIGQGSYGLVKLAYSEEDSTHYAMKILSKRRLLRKAGLMSRGPKKTTSPLDRVYREIAVLKKLDHPNVVKLVEVLDDPLEDSLYLVFELVKQGEVLEIPTDKPLTEERAWSVFRDAVQGLEYLHYQRIIHADIKPGNLLLTECGHVKIADLGVCNEFLGEDATMNNGSTAGTPAFRAPETLFPGQHLYSGKAADIWALGATLYSLVYGNVPFVASSVPLLYEKIKNETLMIPEKPTVSEELVDLIKKMLTKDPAKRITLPKIKEHLWVTANGVHILPSEDDNCRLVQISEEDINSVVKSIPKLDTLILIKTMLKNHSFLNPFNRGISGRAPQRGGSRLERFTRAGRSNSAPGAYHSPIDRQLSGDSILPALSEHGGISSNNDASEDF